MRPRCFILGTDHRFQCGGRDCTPEQAEQFSAELRRVNKAHEIRRIAEEMTAYGRKRYQVSETVAQKVAREMEINHHDTDLSPVARRALAITDDTLYKAIRTLGVQDGGEKIQNAFDDLTNELRERVWVTRILRGGSWPVLVIIGAKHVRTFSRLWRRFGVKVHIVHEDWEPKALD